VFELLAFGKDDRPVRRSPALTAVTALVAAVLTVGLLSGCAGIRLPDLSGDCRPLIEPGDASDLVTVTGEDDDGVPEVEFPTPLVPEHSERTVLIEGTGDPVPLGGVAVMSYTAYDAETGEFLADTFENPNIVVAGDSFGALTEALVCARSEGQIALVTSESQLSGLVPEGPDDQRYVIVIEIGQTFLGKANGVNQLPVSGMPTVATAVDGQPGILVPAEPAPTESQVATIKAGSGATIEDGDNVVLHYRSWAWPDTPGGTPKQLEDTWLAKPREDGRPVFAAPAQVVVQEDMPQGETFYSALEGAKVGSQLLIYLDAEEAGGVPTILVVDVLGIAAPAETDSE
jgi:peptidylprolyl isomerase